MKLLSFIIVVSIFLLCGCSSSQIITQPEPTVSIENFGYSLDVAEGNFNISFNPPKDHAVLGLVPCLSQYCLPGQAQLNICPIDSLPKIETNQDYSQIHCEDVFIQMFPGDIDIEQIIGNGYTSQTTPKIEATHNQNTGTEFTLGYSGQKVFIFKKLGYTFAVFDVLRFSPTGLPQADWENLLNSISVTEK